MTRIPISKPFFGAEEHEALRAPLESGWVVQGPQVAEFERRFAAYTGALHALASTLHALASTSCTTSLGARLAERVASPGPGTLVRVSGMASLSALLRRLPRPLRRAGARVLEQLLPMPALPVLTIVAIVARARRPSRRARPRIVWGPEPILSYAHWSRAMRKAGYESETVMHYVYTSINRTEDFDVLYKDLVDPDWAFLLGPYAAFIRSLFRADIFQHHYSGGFLSTTPLWRFEAELLHLAGGRVVTQAHGNDAYLSSQIADLSLRHALLSSYPALARAEARTRRRVEYWTARSDCTFGGLQMDGLGRWDVLPSSVATIDVAEWRRSAPYSRADGRNGTVRVAHAPNHRGFKGTEFIIAAVEQLRAEASTSSSCCSSAFRTPSCAGS